MSKKEKFFNSIKGQILDILDDNEITVAEAENLFISTVEDMKKIAVIPYKKRMSRNERLSKLRD